MRFSSDMSGDDIAAAAKGLRESHPEVAALLDNPTPGNILLANAILDEEQAAKKAAKEVEEKPKAKKK